MFLTSTRSPSLSSLLFFMDSVSETLDTDSLDVSIRFSAALVFMPVPWAGQKKTSLFHWKTNVCIDVFCIFTDIWCWILPVELVPAGADSLVAEAAGTGLACPPFASFSGSAVLDSFEGRVNIPFPSSHWKYRTPATDPSFFPIGSSSTIPAHCPGANCVPPINCT